MVFDVERSLDCLVIEAHRRNAGAAATAGVLGAGLIAFRQARHSYLSATIKDTRTGNVECSRLCLLCRATPSFHSR